MPLADHGFEHCTNCPRCWGRHFKSPRLPHAEVVWPVRIGHHAVSPEIDHLGEWPSDSLAVEQDGERDPSLDLNLGVQVQAPSDLG